MLMRLLVAIMAFILNDDWHGAEVDEEYFALIGAVTIPLRGQPAEPAIFVEKRGDEIRLNPITHL